jgi:F-type H+-transporting ATPase subunit alpha
MLKELADELVDRMLDRAEAFEPAFRPVEEGTVRRVQNGVVEVTGFSRARADEMLEIEGGATAIVFDAEPDRLGAVLLQAPEAVRAGDRARRTGQSVSTLTGEGLMGRVIDPLGAPRDGRGPVRAQGRMPVERPAPGIMARAPVSEPLQTGIKAVDALVPIGRGQREVILGDRQTGKTAIAIDTILNQAETGVLAVYCAVGQRGDTVLRVHETLERAGALERTVMVVAGGEDSPGLQYVAPYAATSIAEHFMERGRDVVVVYDDLTRHARAYRELSLLLRRPPGREAFPGDIFYLHSRLLERATQLDAEHGGGSMTALPIIETQAQNISAFIPTNLISITDGQIYLSPELMQRGQLPAVDVGRSVSRVGGKAQLPGFRAVAGPLKLAYAQFEELEGFARFGARLDDETRRDLERGRRVRAALRQRDHAPIPVAEQIAVLLAASEGVLDHVAMDNIAEAERVLAETGRAHLSQLAEGAELTDALKGDFLEAARAALEEAGFEADDG